MSDVPDLPRGTTPTAQGGVASAPTSTDAEVPKKDRDPMLDLLDKFEKVSAAVASREPGMAAGLTRLVKQSAEPGRTEQPLFRTQVAYMLQDIEKMAGVAAVAVPASLRTELARLATSSPGLENLPMRGLLSGTKDIGDRAVVRDVRRTAALVAGMPDQNSPDVSERVEVLANRMRLASRAHETAPPVSQPASASVTARSNPTEPATSGTSQDRSFERVRAAASPGDPAGGHAVALPVEQRRAAAPFMEAANATTSSGGKPRGLMSSIIDNARAPSTSRAPWEPPPVAMKARVAAFEETLADGRTDQHIRAAEHSGQVLMQSLETFMTGPGAGVLGRIEAAAGAEPGGMKAVMSEMQSGGRYASLRSEFDNALQQDRAFAASFNAVEKAAGRYGQDRLTLAGDFQARKLNAGQLDARFQQADAAIGEAAVKVPGRLPGQNIMAEMAEKVSEMLTNAVDRVKSMFGQEAEVGRRASSSPGMVP